MTKQRNPWTWGRAYGAEPEAEAEDPKPEAVSSAAMSGGPVVGPWEGAATHEQLDASVPAGVTLPSGWGELTLDDKRAWLNGNIDPDNDGGGADGGEAPAEPAWTSARTHKDVDAAVPEGTTLPDDWEDWTLDQKRTWLDDNAGA